MHTYTYIYIYIYIYISEKDIAIDKEIQYAEQIKDVEFASGGISRRWFITARVL